MYPLTLKPYAPIGAARADEGLWLSIPAEGGDIDVESTPDLSDYRYLVLDITTYANMHLPIQIGFYKKGAEKFGMLMTTSSIPGVRAVMPLDFGWLDNRQIFKARTPGRFKTTVFGETMDASDVAEIKIHIRKFHHDAKILVHGIYLAKDAPDTALIDPKPVLDEFGQVAARNWPGKTNSAGEMAGRLKELYAIASDSKSNGMPFPERFGYTKWGGDASRRLTVGTGFFAVHKDGDVWNLTDPDGYAFFSVGPDCVGTNTASVLTGIEALYAPLPDRTEYADAYNTVPGHFGGDDTEFIDYYRVNMIRVFGKEWFDAYCLITEYQMKQIGFNTIANWSDPDFIVKADMPYVMPLVDFPSTGLQIFRDFPDVFSDEYAKNSVAFAEQLKPYADDARLIGYFMRNEPQWGFSEDINLALEMFRYKTPFESKRALWAFLLDKYGSADDASRAWGIEMECEKCLMSLGFDELSAEGPHTADLKAFSQKMVELYVAEPAKALRSVDPNHLNMGMRYASISSETMFMGTEHVDVFSINCYRIKPRESDARNIEERCGKPCLIGEYHHGTYDRGCFGTSLRAVGSTMERGVAYQYYTEQAAALKSMLGCHYFCLGDEAALGRYDGESWNMGFIDVCQLPYDELCEAAIKTHERIYAVKSGKTPPSDSPPEEVPSDSY
jgi:hypothetical protein